MSFKEGQWMYNTSDDGIWYSGGYFDTKEEAIEEGRAEYIGDYEQFYVGQISPVVLTCGIDTDRIFEGISDNVQEEVGEAAEDFFFDATKEHEKILEDRLNKVLYDWIDEFDYRPTYFKIINTEMIRLTNE